jgi:hypothetical protein
VPEAAKEASGGISLSGQRREFSGQTGEEQNRDSEQQAERTAQNLVETDESDAKWAHEAS